MNGVRLLAVAAGVTACVIASPSPASAQDALPPVEPCGSTLVATVVKDTTNTREHEVFGQTTGNAVVELTDADSTVTLNVPGRVRFGTGDRPQDARITLTGRTVLLPDTSLAVREAFREAGLPDIALITGRVVIDEAYNDEGELTDVDISYRGRVTDVCALLAR